MVALEEDVPDPSSTWLGESDATLLAEDEEKHRKQAVRNKRIRGLLGKRKQAPRDEKQSDAFGEVEQIADPAAASAANDGSEDLAPPWLALRDEPSINLRLHEELLDFAAFMRPTSVEAAARQNWCARIEEAAKGIWEDCEVHLFGSTSTGLCLPCADIDVTVTNIEGVRPTSALKRIADRLLDMGEVSKIEIVQSAKVPVAKLQQRSTGLWADVIINRLDGLDNSRFIREHVQIFPALEPLVLFLKLFLMQRGLHDTFFGGMGSYLLVLVVLSFLQRHPSARNPQLHAKTTLGNLLFDFFRHYGQEFRFGSVGISLLNGGSLFDRVKRGWTTTTRTGQATLSLESPTEPSVDIGARCFKIGVVRAAFNHAYHTLAMLFLKKEVPGQSVLYPQLIGKSHDVIVNRYQLFKEQPPPLLDLPARPDSDEEEEEQLEGEKAEAEEADEEEEEEEEEAEEDEELELELEETEMAADEADALKMPPEKRRKLSAGSELQEEASEVAVNAGSEITLDAGTAESATAEEETCAACMAVLSPAAKFCSQCGANVEVQVAATGLEAAADLEEVEVAAGLPEPELESSFVEIAVAEVPLTDEEQAMAMARMQAEQAMMLEPVDEEVDSMGQAGLEVAAHIPLEAEASSSEEAEAQNPLEVEESLLEGAAFIDPAAVEAEQADEELQLEPELEGAFEVTGTVDGVGLEDADGDAEVELAEGTEEALEPMQLDSVAEASVAEDEDAFGADFIAF